MTNAKSESSSIPSGRPALPASTKLMLAIAIALMVIGGGLWAAGLFQPEPDPAPVEVDRPPLAAFGELDGVPPAAPPPEGLDAWSPMVFRLGFSFFAGFAIAYALRSFLKVTVIVAGLLLLALFGLQYAGLVDVNWGSMAERYDVIVAWLGEQTSSFTEFVRGYLPSTAMGVFGFAVGFRRRG